MVFHDRVEVVRDTIKSSDSFPSGNGRVVIGRYFTDQDKEYSSVHIDELIYFNNSLTNDQIELLGRAV